MFKQITLLVGLTSCLLLIHTQEVAAQRRTKPLDTAQLADRPLRPSDCHFWVKTYTRKDSIKVKGHWRRRRNCKDEKPTTPQPLQPNPPPADTTGLKPK